MPWCSPAHLCGGIEELHFVAAAANEQEELLGEWRVPDHAGGVVALVCSVNVQDVQVVFVALDKIVLDLRRSTETREEPAGGQAWLRSFKPWVSASIVSKGSPSSLSTRGSQHGWLSTLNHRAYGPQVFVVLSLTGITDIKGSLPRDTGERCGGGKTQV